MILPPVVGGLKDGLLEDNADFGSHTDYDVSCTLKDERGLLRARIWDEERVPSGMRVEHSVPAWRTRTLTNPKEVPISASGVGAYGRVEPRRRAHEPP